MTECPSLPRLVAWWLDDRDDDGFELHVLECDRCAATANQLANLRDAVADIGAGKLPPIVRGGVLDALCKSARVAVYRGAPGDRIDCLVSPDLDFVGLRLSLPLAGVRSLDVQFLDAEDQPYMVSRDAPFEGDEVIVTCSRHVAATSPEVCLRLVSQPDGRELGRVWLNNRLP